MKTLFSHNIFYLAGDVNQNLLNYIHLLCDHCTNHGIESNPCDDLHVSLTRTVTIRHHWIEGFVASFRKQMENIRRWVDFLLNESCHYIMCVYYLQFSTLHGWSESVREWGENAHFSRYWNSVWWAYIMSNSYGAILFTWCYFVLFSYYSHR